MEDEQKMPPNVEALVSNIRELEKKSRLTATEKKKICLCKLKIAIWACRSEGLELSRYALTEILGPDSSEVFAKTEQAMSEIHWDSKEDLLINQQIKKKYNGQRKISNSSGSIELFK